MEEFEFKYLDVLCNFAQFEAQLFINDPNIDFAFKEKNTDYDEPMDLVNEFRLFRI